MKRVKQWLAGLLSAVLLLSLLPTSALAADSDVVTRAVLAEMIYNKFYSGLTAVDQGFTDIGPVESGVDPCTDAQRTAINVLVTEGVLSGISPTEFSPEAAVNRAELAVILWRATGCMSNPSAATVSYSDVAIGDWYTPAVYALTAAGIITGFSDNTFKPNDFMTKQQLSGWLGGYNSDSFSGFGSGVTRLEMVVAAYENYEDSPLRDRVDPNFETRFTDIQVCSAKEQEAITFFEALGIVQGYNEDPPAFHPYAAASNLQIAMFLKNCAELDRAQQISLLVEGDGQQAAIDAAFDFLEAQGVNVSAVRANPNAPGLTTNLATWNHALKPAAPALSLESGTYAEDQSVTITADTGATIYYTTDGSDPTTSGTVYSGAVTISDTTTLKAVAVKNNLYSEIALAAYTIGNGSDPAGGTYPITIIGPTGEMNSAVNLNEKNEVYSIQGSTTTLYDPHDNPDAAIQNQLKYWVYNGWIFTATKGTDTKTYGPTKYVDEGLRNFLNPLIAENWTLTMNSKSCGYYDYPDSGSSGGSSSSGSSGNKTETTTNPDGSTTTVTQSNGTVTETTRYPDGSKEVVETEKDGTVTTTTTDRTGNETTVVENPNGSSETTVDNKDGSSSTTTVSRSGQVEAEVKLPVKVIEDAAEADQAVALPMPELPVTSDRSEAPTVTMNLAGGRSAKVEIPVDRATPGTVAILVKADGSEQIIKTSVTTDNGVTVTLSDGDTVKIVDNSKNFADVSGSYWAADAIDFATSRELFAGNTETTFNPGGTMTRAMIWTVLARYDGTDTTNTAGGVWYTPGQTWAMDHGISDGANANGTMTREQLATMLYRYAQSKGQGFTGTWTFPLDYPDAERVSSYAYEALCWMTMNGIIGGMTDGTLNPQGSATRAQVAVMLMRFCVNLAE